MRDLSKAIQMQQWSAQEYADARERRDGPHRDILLDYIADNHEWGAWFSQEAREAMGITDDDGTKRGRGRWIAASELNS